MAVIAVAGLGAALGASSTVLGTVLVTAATIGAAYVDERYVYPLFGGDDNAPPDRALDQQLVRSQEGAPIPIVFGVYNRVPLSIAWTGRITEVESSVQQGGGKGGGAQTVWVKNYFQDGLAVVAEGPISFQRIWANGDVLFDYDLVGLGISGAGFNWPQNSLGNGLIYQAIPVQTGGFRTVYSWVIRAPDPSLLRKLFAGARFRMSGISGGTYQVSGTTTFLPIPWNEEFEAVRVEQSDLEFISAEPFNTTHQGFLGRILDPQNISVSANFMISAASVPWDQSKVEQLFFNPAFNRDNPSGPNRNVKFSPMVAQLGTERTPEYQGVATIGLIGLNRNQFFNTFPVSLEAEVPGVLFDVRSALGSIIKDFGRIPALAFDVSGVNAEQLKGYTIQSPRSVIDALRPLLIYYDILTQQEGGRTKFFNRTNITVVAVPDEDLGAYESGGEVGAKVDFSRDDTLRVVSSLSVSFVDQDRNLEVGTAKARWHIGESGDREATQEISLPIAGTKQDFMQFAWRTLRDAHQVVQKVSVQLPPRYEFLAENDAISFTYAGQPRVVLISRVDQTETGLIRIQGSEQVQGLQPIPIESSSLGLDNQQRRSGLSLPRTVSSQFHDVASLRADDHLQPGIYGGFCDRSTGRFGGAGIYESPVSTPRIYETFSSTASEDTIGATLTDLPAATEEMIGVWDRSSTVDVELFHGELQSYGEEATAIGYEFAVIGDEVIRFATATLIDVNTYRLSNLIRGVRDTREEAKQLTPSGSPFMLVRKGSGQFIGFDMPSTADRAWKVATPGFDLEFAREQIIRPQLATLRPFRVAALQASGAVGSDITLSWSPCRRSLGPTFPRGGLQGAEQSSEQFRVIVSRPAVEQVPFFDEVVSARSYSLTSAQQSSVGVTSGSLEFTVTQLGDHVDSKPSVLVV